MRGDPGVNHIVGIGLRSQFISGFNSDHCIEMRQGFFVLRLVNKRRTDRPVGRHDKIGIVGLIGQVHQFLAKPPESTSIASSALIELAAEVELVAEVVAEVAVETKVYDVPRLEKVAMLHAVEECSASRKSTRYSYKVLADPLANDTVTRKLVQQLKSRGVDDLYVVGSGENRGQVALGLFHQKPYAEKRLDEIAVLGFQVHMDVHSEFKLEPACESRQLFADTDR